MRLTTIITTIIVFLSIYVYAMPFNKSVIIGNWSVFINQDRYSVAFNTMGRCVVIKEYDNTIHMNVSEFSEGKWIVKGDELYITDSALNGKYYILKSSRDTIDLNIDSRGMIRFKRLQ
jgi:hypothetical protein